MRANIAFLLAPVLSVGLLYCAKTADADSCSTQLSDWVKWRDDQIAIMLEPKFDAGTEKVIDPKDVHAAALKSFTYLQECRKQNPAFFADGSPVMKALDGFYRFTRAVQWMAVTDPNGKTTHQLALKLTDREYVDYSSPFLQFPPLMVQQDFLKAMDSPQGYQAALKMIDDHNKDPKNKGDQWTALPMRVQFNTTIDSSHRTYGRLLVYVPNQNAPDGGKIDKWILWGIVTPDMDQTTEMHNVSIFAVHTDPSGLNQTTYFGDFWRSRNTAGEIEVTSAFLRDPDPSGNCYQCHKSSVLPFHPKAEYKIDQDGKLVEKTSADPMTAPALNRVIRNYAPPNFGVMPAPNTDPNNKIMDTLDYGPSLGPVDRDRTDDFIKSCSPTVALSQGSIQNVRRAMQCENCHTEDTANSPSLGRINYLLAVHSKRDVTSTFENRESPIATFVKRGWMPPGNKLTDAERNALAMCVLKEYFDPATRSGIFVDWLSGR
jgi:hypothetical protein